MSGLMPRTFWPYQSVVEVLHQLTMTEFLGRPPWSAGASTALSQTESPFLLASLTPPGFRALSSPWRCDTMPTTGKTRAAATTNSPARTSQGVQPSPRGRTFEGASEAVAGSSAVASAVGLAVAPAAVE